MDGKALYSYRKSKRPSECVHISNLGKRCYFGSEEDLLKEFQVFGKIRELQLGENSNSFVVFEDLPASVRFYEHCMQAHAGMPVLIGGRRVKVDYSERVEIVKNVVYESFEENEQILSEKGLVLLRDFISEQEAVELLDWINTQGVWETKLNRRVQHYGYSFDYSNKIISSRWERDIPPILSNLMERMVALKLITELPDQVTINEYEAGKGIGPHIDSHHTLGGEISVISLGSGILMDFYQLKALESEDSRGCNTRKYQRVAKKPVYVPENSLYIMKDEIRFSWEHGIKSRKFDIIQGGKI
ncbi:AlkB domain-containing protein [Cryptosporidium canis]|nr:AlkB domain-containing protein [Cryptosporidium canis]